MANYNEVRQILDTVSGAKIMSIDTITKPTLKGGKSNPMQGRVVKKTAGNHVMVFQNKNGSSYEKMVTRRLAEEGKDPESFELQPRTWGIRIPNTPFVEHKGQYYLEVIFLNAGKSTFYLDGKEIAKSDIEGLQDREEGRQGGLDNKVVIRTFKVDNVVGMRVDGESYMLQVAV